MADEDGNTLTPGEFIRRELDARGWLQRDLAFVLGVPEQAVNQLVVGKRGISADMARSLGEAFGTSPDFILKLQKASEVPAELSRARVPDPGIARKARLAQMYPVREMIKRGWLDPAPETIESQMVHFFGVGSAAEIPHLDHAAKKTSYSEVSAPQIAWLFRVQQLAREMVLPKFSEKQLRASMDRLRALMTEPEEIRHIPRMLSECGIRYVLVESLPGAKIDGACFWLENGSSPVIGMSLRFDRIDNFWFVLRHELEHVLEGHGKATAMIDADLEGENAGVGEDLPPEERQANAAASDFCVPKAQMDSWIARKHPFYAERDLIGFARRLQVHPGIIAGQLRNRTKNYKIFTKFLARVRFAVAPSSVVDGWGQVAPTSST